MYLLLEFVIGIIALPFSLLAYILRLAVRCVVTAWQRAANDERFGYDELHENKKRKKF